MRIVLVLVLIATALAGPAAAQDCGVPGDLRGAPAQVLAQVNAQRAAAGLAALAADPVLARAAQIIACDNAALNRLGHQGRDGSTLRTRLRRLGYAYRAANENVAEGPRSAAQAVRIWMDSGPHRANLLDRRVSALGVGVAAGPGGRLYWATVGARPP